MNRILTLVVALLVLGIALSRTNDILIVLSPYQAAEAAAVAAPPGSPAPLAEESELAGRTAAR